MSHLLDPLFKPKTIAVIGASQEKSSIGALFVQNIIDGGFKGKVFPINSDGGKVHDLKSHKSISEITGGIDLAIIAEPSESVSDAILDCRNKGVRAVMIATSEPYQTSDLSGVLIMGPNSIGLINNDVECSLNATLSSGPRVTGHAALISQSGTLGTSLIKRTEQDGLGLSLFASIGSGGNVSIIDILKFCEQDENTEAVLIQLPEFYGHPGLAQLCRQVGVKKPIVLLKPGKSTIVTKPFAPDNGITGEYELDVEALLSQCGVIRVGTVEELFAVGTALINCSVPKGNRVGIVSNPGGPTSLIASACAANGLAVDPSTIDKLSVPSIPSSKQTDKALETALKSDEFDMAILSVVTATDIDLTEMKSKASKLSEKYKKPIIGIFGLLDGHKDHTLHKGFSCFEFPETAAAALASLEQRRTWLEQEDTESIGYPVTKEIALSVIEGVLSEKRKNLTLPETYMVLDAYGINVPRYSYAKDLEEALSAAHGLEYPVSMKLLSKDLVNKPGVNTEFIGIKNADDLTSDFLTILSRAQRHELSLDGVLIQEVINGSDAISFAVFDDTEFGRLIALGDESSHKYNANLWPISANDGKRIVHTSSISFPKSEEADVTDSQSVVEETLVRLSQLANDFPAISEIAIQKFMIVGNPTECKTVEASTKLR